MTVLNANKPWDEALSAKRSVHRASRASSSHSYRLSHSKTSWADSNDGGRRKCRSKDCDRIISRSDSDVDSGSSRRRSFRPPDFRNYSTIEEVIRVAFEHRRCLPPPAMAALWTILSRKVADDGRCFRMEDSGRVERNHHQLGHKLDVLVGYTISGFKAYHPKELSQTALWMAKAIKAVRKRGRVTCHQEMFHDALVGRDMRASDCIFRAIAAAAVPLLPRFDPQAYSTLAYACAITGVDPVIEGDTLLCRIADNLMALRDLREFEPQTLSNIVWAFATASVSHGRLFDKVAHEVTEYRSLTSFNAQDLSNIVWAYAKAQISSPRLFRKVAKELCNRSLQSFKPQNLANVVWSYATLRETTHSSLFHRVAEEVCSSNSRHLRSFNAQNLSNIVWAYATARIVPPLLFDRVAIAVAERKREFTPHNVSIVLWAYATSGLTKSPLFAELAPVSAGLFRRFTSQQISNVAWSYAVSNVNAPDLFDGRFVDALLEKANGFNALELSQLYQWHIWQKNELSHAGLPRGFEGRCHESFVSHGCKVSSLQNQVASVLHSIGLETREEELTRTGYSLDILARVNGENIGVEVDGPSHFIGKTSTGSSMLKRRHLREVEGMVVVSVPYWEWDELSLHGDDEKKNYLRSMLGMK